MANAHARQFAVVIGASSGIGYELAKQFAQNGFDLLITSTDSRIVAVARELQRLGAQVQPAEADLATYDGVEHLYQVIRAAGRQVDAIAINAVVGGTDLQAELNLIQLNVASTVHLAKRVLADMVARRQGRVLFTSSIAALMPGTFESVYAASRAFIQSFAEALRNEFKDTGVTITALQPGPTETNFFHCAEMDDTKVGASEKDDPAQVARQGFDALMAGKDHVIADSLKTKTQVAMTKVLPDTTTAQVHRGMSEPGSAKQ